VDSLFKLQVKTQTTNFVVQHVKARGSPCLQSVLALDHAFIDLRSPFNVVALHREQLLKNVSRTVSFQRPDFHFSEIADHRSELYHRVAAG
jgi:hypothetical protein